MASSESNITKDIYTMDVGRKNGSFQSAILWIMIYWFQTFPYTSAIWKRPQDNFVKIICCLKTNQFFQSLIYEILQPPEEEELIKKIEETARKWVAKTEISLMFLFMLGQRQKIPRFDGSGRGELSDREVFNVLKMQHKVNISQEKVRTQCNVVKNYLRTVAITRFCWLKSPRC